MPTSSPTIQALDGASIDGGLYTNVTDFARDTHWLNGPVEVWTSYGIALFGVLMLVGWWMARRADSETMAAALGAPIATALAYVVNSGIKTVFQEPRPCRALPHDFLLEACPPTNDYAFPSNHTTVAFAVAASLFLINRKLAAIASAGAVLMGASRVYVGAHYPHDVLVGALVGSLVATVTVLAVRRYGASSVRGLSRGALQPLLTVAA